MAEPRASAASPPRRQVYRARVERIHDHNSDTRSLFLSLVDGGRFAFIPGQFISISLALENETRVRPYTIASSPEDAGPIEICFNRVPGGAGVRYLFERKAGDELQFTGPFGAFTMERAPAQECVFVAEGTAIAPVRPMIRRALGAPAPPPMSLLYGAADSDHLLYRDEIAKWSAARINFTPIVAPASELYAQIIAEAQRRWIDADSERGRQFYVCGVGKGVLALRDLLRGAGYERRAVHYEQW
ncbi:MAG TPA: FAD-dependent oxidoreductase [Candidatus Binataceae bacterium]